MSDIADEQGAALSYAYVNQPAPTTAAPAPAAPAKASAPDNNNTDNSPVKVSEHHFRENQSSDRLPLI